MRIRSTKPEFWKSRRVASVSWDARLILKGLESYVDDNGVGVDDIELIVSDVFPRDMFANGRETVGRVSEGISELHRAGLLHRYEGGGDRLLYIAFWDSIQRIDKPGKGRNPRPDGTFEYKASEIRESVASPPDSLAPGTGEQRNRGTGEQRQVKTCPATQDEFIDWYLIYPRHEGKGLAEKAYMKARKKVSAEVLTAGAQRYADDPNREKQFTKLPASWLNAESWDDEPLPAKTGSVTQLRPTGSQVRLQAGLELIQRTQARQQERQQPQFEIED